MLAAIDVRVYPDSDCLLPHPCAHMLHAALLDMVRSEDPAASRELHDDARNKPFSVSTLWPKIRVKGDSLAVPKLTECRFRLCTLGKPTFEEFSKPLFSRVAANHSLRLGPQNFSFLMAEMAAPYGGVATFSELLEEPRASALLRFVSPTTFRRKGLNLPLPDPQLVYGSLWQKWQTFSDVPVEESVFEEMSASLALSATDGHTRVWKFPHFMMNGFVGLARFELVRPTSTEAACLFGALSKLAFYSGIGYRTTMGMGQCRLLEEDEPAPKQVDENLED